MNMKLIISEDRLDSILKKTLSVVFDGFEDIYWNWADFDCGWGVCCDIYAVGFTLPNDEHDNYIFKLVDGENYDDDGDYPEELRGALPEECYNQPDLYDPRFDTIVFYEEFAEKLELYLGNIPRWEDRLLNILNESFNMNATKFLII